MIRQPLVTSASVIYLEVLASESELGRNRCSCTYEPTVPREYYLCSSSLMHSTILDDCHDLSQPEGSGATLIDHLEILIGKSKNKLEKILLELQVFGNSSTNASSNNRKTK